MQRLALLLMNAVLMAPAGDDAGGAAGGKADDSAAKNGTANEAETKLRAELDAANKQLADLKKAADEQKKQGDAAKKKELEEQGNFKALNEKLAQEKADLEKRLGELTPDAELGKKHREALQKQIDEGAAKLQPADKAILESIKGLEAQSAFLARINGAPPPPANQPAGAGAGAGGGGSQIDFAAAFADPTGVKWAEAKKRDAKGAAAWFDSVATAGSQPVSFLRPRPAKSA